MKERAGTAMLRSGKYSIWFAAAFVITAAPMAAYAGGLRIYTSDYPPIVFEKDGKATGLAAEAVDEIQRRLKTDNTIEFVPWARGYDSALHDPNVALFTTMRTPEREDLFKWAGPLTSVNTSFYVKTGSDIKISSLADAKSLPCVIVPNKFYTEQILKKDGFENLEGAVSPEMMLNKLIGGRCPAMATDNITLPTLLANVKASAFDVTLKYTFSSTDTYVVFSKDTPDGLVAQWNAALNDMKRDGTYARIYAKWLPRETPPGIK